ncbi:MAG: EamA family transporter RarD [Acidimicrobiales bacterium]|jgi:chloramphenicol-sensitive protein RarD|nr:EamA family transporter RarD [Acidimicrobiales bacterium]HJM28432.1 EamA family transporter RarD [Acidimicrobiales bacterium]HJM97642.1 EamA family transporter RarD [Acidimicrobiales bacterium]
MNDSEIKGVWLGLSGYVLWGLSPIFWKALNNVAALDILSWRIICTFIFAICCNGLLKLFSEKEVGNFLSFENRFSIVAGLLIAFNWGMFIWAVETDHVVDASLGYFMNPLMSVFLGVVFLRETLRLAQWASVALAGLGVIWLTISLGSFPWISITLAISFAFYGLIRKVAPAGPLKGLTIETTTLFVPAILLLLIRGNVSENLSYNTSTTILIILSGVVTGVPLLLFASSVRKIPLSIQGLLQYVTPTIQFLLGVFAYNEEFDDKRFFGYAIIWTGLCIFAFDSFRFNEMNRTSSK